MQERIIWIDNLKVIGILAVILGHISSPLGNFIYSWHMPLFFFLAGFFIKCELSTKEFIIKDFKRLMFPYFIFTAIALILETIKRMVLDRERLDYLYELQGIFIWMDYPSLMNTYAFVLWFLPSLFFSRLIIYTLNKYILSDLIKSFVVLFLFFLSFYFNIFFGIDNAFNAIIFVFLGFIFYRFYQNDKRLYIMPVVLLVIAIYFGIPNLDIAIKSYENILVNILYAVSIIYLLVLLVKKIKFRNDLLSAWSANTMILFIIHPYTNNISHIIVDKFYFGGWYLKFFISLILLQVFLQIKGKFFKEGYI